MASKRKFRDLTSQPNGSSVVSRTNRFLLTFVELISVFIMVQVTCHTNIVVLSELDRSSPTSLRDLTSMWINIHLAVGLRKGSDLVQKGKISLLELRTITDCINKLVAISIVYFQTLESRWNSQQKLLSVVIYYLGSSESSMKQLFHTVFIPGT